MKEYTLTRKVIPVGGSLGITIPSYVLQELEVEKGDLIEVVVRKRD